MDKARFAGATALQYFGLVFKKVSIDEAANQLVQELTEEDSTHGGNSSAVNAGASAASSNAARAALQIMYGQAGGHDHDRKCMAEKIDAARKKFLKGVGDGNKEQSAADFDNKVKGLLGDKLSDRVRFLYVEQKQKMDSAFANGLMTKSECDQSIVQILDEVESACSSDGEVKNVDVEVNKALGFIGKDETRVVRGLYYLFAGKLSKEQTQEFSQFDESLGMALATHFPLMGNEEDGKSETDFKREFIAESRRQLASRLPEPSRSDYFSIEKKKQEEMRCGKITYEVYRDFMQNWVANKSLIDAVKNALGSVRTEEDVCKLLVYIMKEGGQYNRKTANRSPLLSPLLNPNPGVDNLCSSFRDAGYRYSRSDTVRPMSEKAKYERFMSNGKRVLQNNLPDNIGRKLKECQNTLGELRKDGLIIDEGYQESLDNYLLNMLLREQGETIPDSGAKSMDLDKSSPEWQAVQEKVGEALAKCITTEATSAVLEALIMCWEGHVTNHREGFGLYPLCEAKDNYWRSHNSDHTGKPLTVFPWDDTFSIEAREQLCKKLPHDLRQKYMAREALLRQHLENGTITPETYRKGMLMFLGEYFKF